MNNNLYRIVFNKKRGQLMVVAETASAQGKDASGETGETGGGAGAGGGRAVLKCTVSALRFALALAWGTALLVQPIANIAQAQIVANPAAPGGQRPTVLSTANGLPQVNIQTPSAAGVSRNTYSQFDVQRNGVILNNSRTNVQTQLGGFVQGNPWLATGSARVILNEVNSSSASQLNGYVEVAGQKAEIIIANPAGINVNGGGFINASSVTLTTGTAVVNSATGGSLDAYRVQGGNISVNGAGLDTSTADYTNILARSLQVNAGLWARDLKLVTGANEITAASLSSTPTLNPIAGTGPAPTFAVDIGQLGGMYAGKIMLIGSESGVGVSNAGFMGATAGNVVLQTNGWLTSSGVIQAAADAQLSATAGINNTGTVYAGGNAALVSPGDISNTGATAVIAAKGNTTLESGAQVSASALSTIAAGLNTDGAIASSGLLTVNAAGSVTLNGQLTAGGDAVVTGTQLNLTGGTLAAQNANLVARTGMIEASGASLGATNTLSLLGVTTLRTDGAIVSANQLSINVQDLSNAGGQIIQTGAGDLVIALAGALDNTSGRIASNSQNMTLQTAGTGGFINTAGKIEHGGSGALTINVANAKAFDSQRGQITSNGALNITAGTVNLDRASTVAQGISIRATALSNRAGEIVQTGAGDGSITATSVIDNTSGRIAGNGKLTFTAQSLNNQGGVVQVTGASSLEIATSGGVDNSASGQIAAGGSVRVNTAAFNNNQGRLSAGTNLTVHSAGLLTNNQGQIAANGGITLYASKIDNTRGTIAAVQDDASLRSVVSTLNDSGRIEAGGTVTLANSGLSNIAGSITGRTISINSNAQSVNNAQGTISAAQGAALQTGAFNNDKGLVQAGGAVDIDTNGHTLTNTHASGYANGAGGISARGSITLNTGVTGALDNAAGFIGAKGSLTASSANVSNINGGQIVGEAAVRLRSSDFDNRGGQVQAVGDVTLDVGSAGTLNNAAGLVRSAQTVTLLGASMINSNTLGLNQGIEGNNVIITALGAGGSILNDSGAIRTDNNLTLTSRGAVNNNAGLLSAGNTLTVQDLAAGRTLDLTNTAGTLIAGQGLVVSAATAGGDGRLLSRGDLALALTGAWVNSAEVTANRDASITAASITNSGKLQASGTLTIAAGDIDNKVTGEITAATTRLSVINTLTNRGLIDGVTTQIDAGTLNNIGTGRIYGDTLSIAAATLNNDAETVAGVTRAATIAARQQLDIGAATLNNRNGALIFSAGDLAIGGSLDARRKATGIANAVNNAGGTIEALGKLTINAASINNSNPGFAYNVLYGAGPAGKDYVTGAGTFSGAEAGWVAAASTYQRAGHGGYYYGGARGRVIPASSSYGNPVYQPYYDGPNPHQVPVAEYDGEGGYYYSPESFTYDASSPVWALFGVAPPTGATPTSSRPTLPPRPVAYNDGENGSYTPTAAELAAWDAAAPGLAIAIAAWDAAAAPWLALQIKFDAFRSSVAGSALTFDGFRAYTQQVATVNVTASTPGRILSGSDMTLYAPGALTNDQSQVIAGGALNITGQTLNNVAHTETVNTQRTGQAFAWAQYDHGCGGWNGCDYSYQAYRDTGYLQDVPQTLSLNVAVSRSNTVPSGSATLLANAMIGSTSAATSAAGSASASARSAGIVQVTANVTDLGGLTGRVPVIRTSSPHFTLPSSSLFATNPNPSAHYLIETDPRFASYKNWLGSDYMLQVLGYDPVTVQKRLGDGFYEQRLVREQVAQLTGQRFLADYSSDEQQYKALMDAGVTFARQYQLRPGIALSSAQMAQLTSDIVWLVEQAVTLPDGTTAKVLVPQVYVRVKDGDLDGTGALLAGKSININLTGDLTNSGAIAGSTAGSVAGSVAGRNVVSLTAQNLQNLGGRISGNAVSLAARHDINNIGGQIDAANALAVVAGRDLRITSTTHSASNAVGNNTFSLTGLDRIAGLYVSNPGGTLLASAGRDVTLTAAILQSQGSASLAAGNDINLATVKTSSANAQVFDKDNYLQDSQSRDVGSQLSAAGRLTLQAGNDLNARAASVNAGQALVATAGNSINLTAGQSTNSSAFGMTTSDSGFLSSSSTKESKTSAQTRAAGSSFGGATVAITASQDINVKGSSVISDSATTLTAGNNVNLEAASNTSRSTSFFQKTESGFLSGGGLGITYGSREQSTDNKGQNTTAAASTVGSIGGNVSITAGQAYRQTGSDVVAPRGDIAITAKKVDIVEARETANSQTEQKFKQSGITLSVGSPLLSAVQQGQSLAQAAGNTSDARMQALAGASAVFNVLNNADAIGKSAAALASGNPAAAASITLSIGSSQSQSLQKSQSDSARSSSVTAGGNVRISALALRQAQDERGDGNLTVQGASIQAGNNASLVADNQIKLLAAQNTSSQSGSNSSSSSSLGVSYSAAGGWGFSASAAKGKGASDGADTTFTNTRIAAGNTANIQSGGDTTLKGAVVAANTVTAKVGGNLSVESLQDTSSYASQQSSVSGSISVGAGSVTGGGFSASQSKIDSNFKSVGEQSAILAGDGGFQVTVSNNTDLKGAVIASNQSAVDNNKNSFTTGGTLTTRDLQNTASYNGSAAGVSVDAGQQAGKFGASGVGVGMGSDKGSAHSTSAAGISGIAGNTAVRSTDAQAGLKKIFDAARVQREMDAQVQITQAFSKEAPKAVATFAAAQIHDLKTQALAETDPAAKQALLNEADKWGEGGKYRVLLHTLAGAFSGGASGAAGALASAGSAPLMNQLQDGMATVLQAAGLGAEGAKGVAQVIASLTAAGVGAAVGGAQGAATAATVDANNRQLHPTERQRAADLAAKGVYSKEKIEEQMRLMGNLAFDVGPNSVTTLMTANAIANNIQQDPGMPKVVDGTVVMEVPGQANMAIQQYIIANTKDGAGYIPGASPYSISNIARNSPTFTYGPSGDIPTAKCGNIDVSCRSGVGVGVQQSAPMSQQTKDVIGDGASGLSRQAGVVAAAAVAVSSQLGPYGQAAKAVAVGATAIGFGADVVEQLVKPNVGQTTGNLIGFAVGASLEPLPGGKVLAPITNELIEAVKSSSGSQLISTRINEFLGPSTEKVKK